MCLPVEIDCHTVSLADLRSHDESYCGQYEHEKGDLIELGGGRGKQIHRDYDSKIHGEQASDDSPDSLPHRNPDDRDKTQIKMVVTSILESEQDEENSKYRQGLAKCFCSVYQA